MTAYLLFLAACLLVLAFLLGWRAGISHERHRPVFDADDTAWPWPRADIRAANTHVARAFRERAPDQRAP